MDGGILGHADAMMPVRVVNLFPSALENLLRRHPEALEFAADVYCANKLDELESQIEGDGESRKVVETVARD